ncbi:GIY-YIG nuclease family protein [Ileibacterium valens]|uniref:GIY-YIG nuclease family protein n=1 Tax=Ileibacterium valens TaxID=1862668 RepID=UPI00259BD3BB|nr:GIY-YIG nuclease family protein [Ileibacterium valens]
MAKGILYVMSTVVDGLIKIGKTGTNQFETRMNQLEKNGYCNVTGLKREFAIEVEEYDEKEKLLHVIFNKSRIAQTELFATDLGMIVKLLSSFEGKEIFPKNITKEEVFEEVTEKEEIKASSQIPDGIYYLKQKCKGFGPVEAILEVRKGHLILKAGSICAPATEQKFARIQQKAKIKDNKLQADLKCSSISTAGTIAVGKSVNGWIVWKDESGKPVDQFRAKD